MADLSLARAAADPASAGRVALLAEGKRFTFADLEARAAPMRAALAAQGVTAGVRVALRAKNEVSTLVAIYALLDLGATLVPIHPRLTPSEATVLVDDAAPGLVLGDDDLAHLRAAPRLGQPIAHDPATALAILYTSGTTGRPKGAVLSRRAFLAAAAASAQNLGWTEQDRWILCMPLCHVGGLSIVTRCLLARRPVVLLPRFDAEAVIGAVREGATLLSAVPTMMRDLLERDHEGVLARLRAVLVGGAAAPPSLLDACATRGVKALATYGLTEACSQVTAQRLVAGGPPVARHDAGHPLEGVELRIGASGTIHVRGPALMDGYFAGPGAPLVRGAFDAGGWLDTGDLGELDADGALHVHARRVDLIVSGGENVYPLEVEQRLEGLPGVRAALVFGVPDERWGQLVAAAIVLAPDASFEAVSAGARAALASHKRPRLACAVEALASTASGKLVRAGAAERYAGLLRPFAASARSD